jgi:hypothetical protein
MSVSARRWRPDCHQTVLTPHLRRVRRRRSAKTRRGDRQAGRPKRAGELPTAQRTSVRTVSRRRVSSAIPPASPSRSMMPQSSPQRSVPGGTRTCADHLGGVDAAGPDVSEETEAGPAAACGRPPRASRIAGTGRAGGWSLRARSVACAGVTCVGASASPCELIPVSPRPELRARRYASCASARCSRRRRAIARLCLRS